MQFFYIIESVINQVNLYVRNFSIEKIYNFIVKMCKTYKMDFLRINITKCTQNAIRLINRDGSGATEQYNI